MSTDDSSLPSPAAVTALQELELQAVRLRARLANADDLFRAADAALDAGIYSPGLAEVAFFAEKQLSELSVPYLAAMGDLGIITPENEEGIIWYLLRRYIGDVAAGTVGPKVGAARVVSEVDRHFHLDQRIKKYVGDSHGIEYIMSLYYAYDDVDENRFAEVDGLLVEACREWMQEALEGERGVR
ncbi:MAG: hypothetical protein KF712_04350 [Akkermansiaceae bacterium]|nr:hypothetical protein [Akkermansiaceae bacterium]